MRLGLVGLDSSHADQVVDLVARGRLGPDVRLTMLGAPTSRWAGEADPERAAGLAWVSGTSPLLLAGTPETIGRSAVGAVDAVVVADRDGRAHAQHAAPFLRSGIPVFVDKPFTLDVEEALGLVALADESGAVLTSFSPLRWQPAVRGLAQQVAEADGPATVVASGPVVQGSPYGGLAFYAVHAVEAALTVVRGPLLAVRLLDGPSGGVGLLELKTERDVATVVLVPPSGGAQVPFAVSAEVGAERWACEVPLGDEYLLPGLEVFCAAAQSGVWPLGARAMVDVVRALEALR